MADSKATSLSEISVPALEDLLYTVDDPGGTPASNKLTAARAMGNWRPSICEGRLTLETGVAVSTADQTAKTTIYFTPYRGNRIVLYDGTRWKFYAFTERSLALGTLTSGKNYDVFLYDNAGTLTLEFSAAWTNDTTRADALTTQDGIFVKSGATTRRWLGTMRTTATTTTEDSDSKRFVNNYYNRVLRRVQKIVDSANHTYGTGAWRAWNNDTANKFEFVAGHTEASLNIFCQCKISAGLTGNPGYLGADLDAAVGPEQNSATMNSDPNAIRVVWYATLRGGDIGVGYHYIQAIEYGNAGSAPTYEDLAIIGLMEM